MAISQIMRRNLITLDMDDTLSDAKGLFEHHDMHHILITEEGKLTGVITDRDLLQHLSPTIGTRKETPQDTFILNKKVHLIMSTAIPYFVAETMLMWNKATVELFITIMKQVLEL